MSADALTGIQAPEFNLMVAISFRLSEPWRDLHKHLQKHRHLVRDTGLGALAHLAFTKEASLRQNVADLIFASKWTDNIESCADPALRELCWPCIQHVSHKRVASWKLRITDRVESSKVQLLVVAKTPHNSECEDRRKFAKRLLAGEFPPNPSMAKLAKFAAEELAFRAETRVSTSKVL